MSSRTPDLLSNIFSLDRRRGSELGGVSLKLGGNTATPHNEPAQRFAGRRTAIWQMHPSMHCSIVGTCLSAADLRRMLIKLGVTGAETADDHTLHKQGVALAAQPQEGGKFIQRALDRRHQTVIKQCAKANDEEAILRFWEDSRGRGEIPGAYWAVLSHPAATERVMRQAFGDVHMLSHIMGAANRADIRRLRQLEEENAALAGKLEVQQRRLREGFVARDEEIRQLTEKLERVAADLLHVPTGEEVASAALADLRGRFERADERREWLEMRAKELVLALAQSERERSLVETENAGLHNELERVETQLGSVLGEGGPPGLQPDDAATPLDLSGSLVLYVGGRAHQVPQLRAVVERASAAFLHHDGGLEHAAALLPGFVSRADVVVFPIDCISHDAMGTVKRLCRQSGKAFVPLRTSSLASLLSGLVRLRQRSAGTPEFTAPMPPATPAR